MAWWLLVAIVVLSVARAVAALQVRGGIDPAAARWQPTHLYQAQIADARSVVSYSVVVGFALAVVLVPVGLALRGPLGWARWTAFGLLCASLLTQVLYISSDLGDAAGAAAIVPGWYPPTQQALETVLMVASIAVLVLLLPASSAHYFDEGVGRREADHDDFDRAIEAIRRKTDPSVG